MVALENAYNHRCIESLLVANKAQWVIFMLLLCSCFKQYQLLVTLLHVCLTLYNVSFVNIFEFIIIPVSTLGDLGVWSNLIGLMSIIQTWVNSAWNKQEQDGSYKLAFCQCFWVRNAENTRRCCIRKHKKTLKFGLAWKFLKDRKDLLPFDFWAVS